MFVFVCMLRRYVFWIYYITLLLINNIIHFLVFSENIFQIFGITLIS